MTNMKRRFGWLFILSIAGFSISFCNQLIVSFYFGTSATLDQYLTFLSVAGLLLFYVHPIREALISPVHAASLHNKKLSWAIFTSALAVQSALVLVSIFVIRNISEDFFLRIGFKDLGNSAFSKIIIPYFFLFVLAESFNGILLSFNRVIYQSISRLLSAVVTLFCLFILVEKLGILALMIGLLLSQLITLILSIVGMYLEGYRPVWLGFKPLIRAKGFLPTLIALLLSYLSSQIYVLFEKSTMSNMMPGLAASFQYSTNLVNVGISLFIHPLMNLLWPQFLLKSAPKDTASTVKAANKALTPILIILLIGCAFTFTYAEEIIKLIYYRGKFDMKSVDATALSLRATIFAAVPIAVYSIYTRLLLSIGNAKALFLSGLIISISGIFVIGISASSGNIALIRWHWFLANAVGATAAVFMTIRGSNMERKAILGGILWFTKIVTIILVSLVFLPTINPAASQSKLLFELIIRFGLMLLIALPLIHVSNVYTLRLSGFR